MMIDENFDNLRVQLHRLEIAKPPCAHLELRKEIFYGRSISHFISHEPLQWMMKVKIVTGTVWKVINWCGWCYAIEIWWNRNVIEIWGNCRMDAVYLYKGKNTFIYKRKSNICLKRTFIPLGQNCIFLWRITVGFFCNVHISKWMTWEEGLGSKVSKRIRKTFLWSLWSSDCSGAKGKKAVNPERCST